MSSNRLGVIDDEKYWNDTKIKGFGFGEEGEAEEDVFFGSGRDVANKINQDLRAEVSSLSSFASDGSNDEAVESLRLKELPTFLWSDSGPLELELERPIAAASDIYVSRDETRPMHFPSVDETIHQFLNCDQVVLEHYKSLAQKKQLLGKAIEINDGNAILGVTLFLYRSLKHSIFRQILVENKAAANHYVRYLESKNETNHLVDLLNMLGRTKEAMIVKYKQILRKEGNFQHFLKELQHFHKAECQFSNEDVASLIAQHLQLLHIQKEIKEKKDLFFTHTDYPSVLKTLKFVAEHFYENTVPSLTIDFIKQKFSLNTKQYTWVVLNALVVQKKWPQIEGLLLTKNWLGSSKDRCLLPLEEVCNTLQDAPVDLTSRFVRLIDDTERKLTLAKKLKCHMVYAYRKDRAAILNYRANLEEHSKEFVYSENVIKQTAIKWKN